MMAMILPPSGLAGYSPCNLRGINDVHGFVLSRVYIRGANPVGVGLQ